MTNGRLSLGSDDACVFEGYASLFNKCDQGGDVVVPGAFRASLLRIPASRIRMLFQHDCSQILGSWLSVSEDAKGLLVRGRLDNRVSRSRELAALVTSKALDGLSIGFKTKQYRQERGVRYLTQVDLIEVSLVVFPMLSGARIVRYI